MCGHYASMERNAQIRNARIDTLVVTLRILNKDDPKTPQLGRFRPIRVKSNIMKFMEGFLYEGIQRWAKINCMEQFEFVAGVGSRMQKQNQFNTVSQSCYDFIHTKQLIYIEYIMNKQLKLTQAMIQQLQKMLSADQFKRKLNIFLNNSKGQLLLIQKVYSYATINSYTCQQKCQLINHCLEMLNQLSIQYNEKVHWINKLQQKIIGLSKRNPQNLQVNFNQQDSIKLSIFLKKQFLPYYQFYEAAVQNKQYCSILSKLYQPIEKIQQQPLIKGKIIQVENVQILKEFIGIRQPKQAKNQIKKK